MLGLFSLVRVFFTNPLQIDGYAEERRGMMYELTGAQTETVSVMSTPNGFPMYTVRFMDAGVEV
ncbi:hypothetical protein GB937_008347 [Aspergillus fischeri]|nr:hypothetical protein GB937_008347 [Aspergillus fischeri]